MADMEGLAAETVGPYGGIDILVNNAARALGGRVDEIDESDWNTVINTNLTSVWRGMRVAVPEMIKRGGGAVVNMSSVQIADRFQGLGGLRLCKRGINALTQQAAIDLAPFGIEGQRRRPGHDHDAAQSTHLRAPSTIRRR